MFHFRKKKIKKFCSFCAINLLYAKIQSRDGHAVVMQYYHAPRISLELSSRDGHAVVTCTIITLFHYSYKIFVYKTKKLYTGEKKYILYHRKNGTTVLQEYRFVYT